MPTMPSERSTNSASAASAAHEIPAQTRAALESFQRVLEARGAPETTRRYLQACEHLVAFLGDTPIAQIDGRDAQRCLAQMHASGIAPRTLATSLSAWKTWLRTLARSDAQFRADVFDTVRVPKPPKRLPNALSEPEMAQLLGDATSNEATDEGASHPLRDRAMFELLYGCGLRVSELTGLDVDQLDLSAGEVRVYGKGRKERIVPLGRVASDALRAWLDERAMLVTSNANDVRALFLGTHGKRVAATVVRKALAETAIARGISSHVHPHRLRHSFASHVLQSSRDLRAVQELMGHASIASTQVYTHLDFQHLSAVYDDAHPRAKRNKSKK
jgi:integrase/recombinase XerC